MMDELSERVSFTFVRNEEIPHSRRTRLLLGRSADRQVVRDRVDQASEDSFPCSDAPAWIQRRVARRDGISPNNTDEEVGT